MELELYGELCGRMLAKAHARSGDRIAIAGFLDAGKAFEQAMERDAVAYADQAEQDYQLFVNTIKEGRLEASLLS
jgi:predicted alpha/beta hydrolase